MTAAKEKYMLIMGGGLLTLQMYKKCKELGLKIFAFEWNLDAPALYLADKVEQVNMKNIDDVKKKAKEAGKQAPIAGVVTCGADLEIAVAVAAEALGLPGIPVEVARVCNDKAIMRQKLDKLGLGDTIWNEVTSMEAAFDAADRIGFPCFLKPVDNCGSRGCKRIESFSDIRTWWDEALKFSVCGEQRVLLEEYQDGPRQTIEMIVDKGVPRLVSIIDTHYIYEEPEKYPFGHWPVETGLNMTELSPDVQEQLFKHASKIITAIGVNWGPVKVDTTVTPSGIQTVELTARLSGGFHCQYATPLSFGTDEIKAVAKMAIGEDLDMELLRHKYNRSAVVQAKFPNPGRIKKISGVKEAKQLPGVHEVFILKNVGEFIPNYQNSTDRVAFVIADGETLPQARQNVQKGLDALIIETEN